MPNRTIEISGEIQKAKNCLRLILEIDKNSSDPLDIDDNDDLTYPSPQPTPQPYKPPKPGRDYWNQPRWQIGGGDTFTIGTDSETSLSDSLDEMETSLRQRLKEIDNDED